MSKSIDRKIKNYIAQLCIRYKIDLYFLLCIYVSFKFKNNHHNNSRIIEPIAIVIHRSNCRCFIFRCPWVSRKFCLHDTKNAISIEIIYFEPWLSKQHASKSCNLNWRFHIFHIFFHVVILCFNVKAIPCLVNLMTWKLKQWNRKNIFIYYYFKQNTAFSQWRNNKTWKVWGVERIWHLGAIC